MAKQIGEDTKVTLDLKTLGMIGAGIISLAGMWFALQADIAEAKELPKPDVSRMEFNMKDQMARNKIDAVIKEMDELKEEIKLLRK